MFCKFDDDLAKQATATSNRIRGLLTLIHPALERVLARAWTTLQCWTCCGPGHTQKPYATPAGAGSGPAQEACTPDGRTPPRRNHRRPGPAIGHCREIERGQDWAAPTGADARRHPRVRGHRLHQGRSPPGGPPSSPGLTSLSAVGVKTAARTLTEIVGKDFTSAGHLAFAALKDPSRAYYYRKRTKDKRHNRALITIARRRCDTLNAMRRDGTLFEPRLISTA